MEPEIGSTVIVRYDDTLVILLLNRDGTTLTPHDSFSPTYQLTKLGERWAIEGFEKYHVIDLYPRQIRTPGSYYSTIIETSKFRLRSSLGGLHKDIINSGPFVALSHLTELLSLPNIIRLGKLHHRLSLSRQAIPARGGISSGYPEEEKLETSAFGQRHFPGVYMRSYTQKDFLNPDFPEIPSRFCQLIFSTALLRQRNWHINIADNHGVINNRTFTSETLSQYLLYLPQLWGEAYEWGIAENEIIFHDPVSLSMLEVILVDSEATRLSVAQIIGPEVPILVTSKQLGEEFSQRRFNKERDLSASPPQLCSTGIAVTDPDRVASIEDVELFNKYDPYTPKNYISGKFTRDVIDRENEYIWNKRLESCGIREKYTKGREEELLKLIEQRMQQIYFEDAPRTSSDPPPWRYVPGYYRDNIDPFYLPGEFDLLQNIY